MKIRKKRFVPTGCPRKKGGIRKLGPKSKIVFSYFNNFKNFEEYSFLGSSFFGTPCNHVYIKRPSIGYSTII